MLCRNARTSQSGSAETLAEQRGVSIAAVTREALQLEREREIQRR